MTWPIYNQEASEWLSQENFEDAQYKIVTQKIVNDIASMSVEDKIKYIEESSHFTADQKNAIKFEFLFKVTRVRSHFLPLAHLPDNTSLAWIFSL